LANDLRIYLTGRVGIEHAGELVIREQDFRGRQERMAFAYLVSERLRPVPREELVDVLWPEDAPPAWQAALSVIVSRLRSLFGREPVAAIPASISKGFGQYRMFLPKHAWVDLEAAANAVDAAEQALRTGRPREAFGPAGVAANIARRPFLSGPAAGWVADQRARLARVRVRAQECLAQVWLHAGEGALAVEAASDALAVEPLRESSYRLLMEAHRISGNRAEGLNVYERLRSTLAEQLGADPSRETERVYLELLR
jgi:DNA-binding SARP family transcriptional activator